jgi:CBS domain-containing protein
MNIEAILSAKGRAVETVLPETTIADAMSRMANKRISALIISRDGRRISGIVTDRGILWAISERGTGVLDEPVGTAMTAEVVTCRPTDSVGSLMALITERRIRHVPVVDDGGDLAGIVSIGDIVKHRLDEIQLEADSLREYIGAGY